MRDRFVDKFPLADGRVLEFVFEDFPQKVCSSCGERYYEAKDLIAAGVTAKTISRWKTGHREEERHRLTLEAMADVDAGHVIDHQAVQAWADGLGTRKPRPPPRR